MIRRLFRLLVASGLLLAAVLLVRRTVRLRDEGAHVPPSPDRWPPIPAPQGAAIAPPTISPAAAAWLPPVDGGCPPTHPVKVKEASGIYHLPGMLNYERTKPDRCYAEESGAVADGFARSKR